jgi:hypothetical protein
MLSGKNIFKKAALPDPLLRVFDVENDYPMLTEWWKGWNWPPVPLECLPKLGLIVGDCAAGFLYESDSNIAWLEWIISDPTAEKIMRSRAVDAVIGALWVQARARGFKKLFTSTNSPSLEKRLESRGFQVTDRNVTFLIGDLCQ